MDTSFGIEAVMVATAIESSLVLQRRLAGHSSIEVVTAPRAEEEI